MKYWYFFRCQWFTHTPKKPVILDPTNVKTWDRYCRTHDMMVQKRILQVLIIKPMSGSLDTKKGEEDATFLLT
jgi:hypothetical protein